MPYRCLIHLYALLFAFAFIFVATVYKNGDLREDERKQYSCMHI